MKSKHHSAIATYAYLMNSLKLVSMCSVASAITVSITDVTRAASFWDSSVDTITELELKKFLDYLAEDFNVTVTRHIDSVTFQSISTVVFH